VVASVDGLLVEEKEINMFGVGASLLLKKFMNIGY
jgi:hypothetical protein